MRRWRFLPLRDFPASGILVSPDGKPVPASFLTPAPAKADAQQRRRANA